MAIDCIDQSWSTDISCSTDNYIFANIEVVVEFFDLLRGNRVDYIFVASWWLSQVVILNKYNCTLKAV